MDRVSEYRYLGNFTVRGRQSVGVNKKNETGRNVFMKRILTLSVLAVAFLVLSADTSFGQKVWYTGDVKATVAALEANSDRYAESLNKSMDATWIDGKEAQDEINHWVDKFEEATDKLKGKVEDQQSAKALFNEVVFRARVINAGMLRYKVSPQAEKDWDMVRSNINSLGKSYAVVIKW
jgi:cytochrome c556